MADTYREYLVERIAKRVMRQVGGFGQVNAKYPEIYKDVKDAIRYILIKEDIE